VEVEAGCPLLRKPPQKTVMSVITLMVARNAALISAFSVKMTMTITGTYHRGPSCEAPIGKGE
jgi:hypothetical protein